MDTVSHGIIGVGLFGLAHADPVLAADPITLPAILLATSLGSQAPDVDTIWRLRGKAVYFRNHRSWSHSIPMMFLWPALITYLASLFFPLASVGRVFAAAFVAVVLHVFLDVCNTYGTQALLPFSRKWLSLDFIPLFDPIIFGSHVVCFVLWAYLPTHVGTIFLILYLLLVCHVIGRRLLHQKLYRCVHRAYPQAHRVSIIASTRLKLWRLVVETPDEIRCGELQIQTMRRAEISWKECIAQKDRQHPAAKQSASTSVVSALRYFTKYASPVVHPCAQGYEVQWYDVRFLSPYAFALVATVIVQPNGVLGDSSLGWTARSSLDRHPAICSTRESLPLGSSS